MVHILNGLATSMLLFLVASGLNIIFGILGVINFAHGTLFLLGAYVTLSVIKMGGSFWLALIVAPPIVALIGGAIEYLLCRRLYGRHHIYQILLTFALVLVINDLIKLIWGADLKSVSPPPVLSGVVPIFGKPFSVTSLFIIVIGFLSALGLWVVFQKTRIGKILRAVSSDREISNALGFNVKSIYSLAFMVGAFLAGVGGVLGTLRISFTPGVDVEYLIFSFAVVVIGGLGSFLGSFIGAIIVGEMYSLGIFAIPSLAMSFVFILLVLTLVARPRGLFGRIAEGRHIPIAPYMGRMGLSEFLMAKKIPLQLGTYLIGFVLIGLLVIAPVAMSKYWTTLVTEIFVFAIFATSFNLLLGYTGMLSFGQAALFGAGAYTVSLIFLKLTASWPIAFLGAILVSALVAVIIGYLSIHRAEIYFAMLTLAFAQLFYTVIYKWTKFTGGSDGLIGIPFPKFNLFGMVVNLSSPAKYYYFSLVVMLLSLFILRRIVQSPFGQMLLAIRENPVRLEFTGINPKNYKLISFVIAGIFSGLAGALFAPFEGTIDPGIAHWAKSADPVFMSLAGGITTFIGPTIGSAVFLILSSVISTVTQYWMLIFGLILISIVILFPSGMTGFVREKLAKWIT
ncbi:MAG: ABC transporter permease [Thermodesulfobacteriota bacterium]|jgi:branched-chain amino acid transport system permease protein